jgi:hypothetical protein
MSVRRVITGHTAGKSTFVSDGLAPRSHDFVHIPGMSMSLVWSTPAVPAVPYDNQDRVSPKTACVPPAGESRLIIQTFPPDSVYGSPSFDGAAAAQETREHVREIAERMEPANPGMHTTDTIDYGIVLDGDIWLELDDGAVRHLKPHDVVIQNGTRHAWRNRSDKPATVAFVLIGARRKT